MRKNSRVSIPRKSGEISPDSLESLAARVEELETLLFAEDGLAVRLTSLEGAFLRYLRSRMAPRRIVRDSAGRAMHLVAE
jgi:hypothetical protein